MPPVGCVGVEEIGEGCLGGPCAALKDLVSFKSLQEHVVVLSFRESAVPIILSHGDACVDDGHELERVVLLEEVFGVGGEVSEVLEVHREVLVVVHVVDVGPLHVQRDPVLVVLVNDVLVLVDRAQAVLALVPSEGPDGRQEGLSDDAVVVADHRVRRVRVDHHVDVRDASSRYLLKLGVA